MNLTDVVDILMRKCIPRVSGDEPLYSISWKCFVEYSPRERG